MAVDPAEHRPVILGIDIGGTFTDIVAYHQGEGRSYNHKELTTPDEPQRGVISGVKSLFESVPLDYSAVGLVVHATTLFTNALIERRGAVTGLITTAGFRDTLEIAREMKYDLYDIFLELPRPLVPSSLRREVPERMSPAGEVEIALDENALLAEVEQLMVAGVTSLGIVFLHAYANPLHERRAKAVIAERFPSLSVSISSEVSPEIREYERSSTTVANAYIKPMAVQYMDRLRSELVKLGLETPLSMMLSNGGLTHIAEAQERPVQLLESGPAAGALAGAYFGTESDIQSVLAFDMGGTTAKLSVVDDGVPLVSYKFEAAREKRFAEGSGLPITISTIDLIEIGAGGGSIASVDTMQLLKVGPESAASVPGPACFGRGGTHATVTDANMVLGYLDPRSFAAGKIPIDLEAAEAALDRLSGPSGLSRVELAWGIHNIVNERMANAARVHIAERGRNLLRYSMVTTGGGGPLHGCEVARKIGIERVLCPPGAGVASALGMMMAPARIDRVATIALSFDRLNWQEVEQRFAALEQEAIEIVRVSAGADTPIDLLRSADLRCIGQGFEVVTKLPSGPYDIDSGEVIANAFVEQYRSLYFRPPPRKQIELINIRVSAVARTGRKLTRRVSESSAEPARSGERAVFFYGSGYLNTPVYARHRLAAGETIAGPAVVEEPETTLIVPPDMYAQVETNGTIIVELRVPGTATSAGTARAASMETNHA